MIVFVINKNGKKLMPCTQRKARILLKNKKAIIYSYKPFTIQLLYGSYGYTQETTLKVDLGSRLIGIAIERDDNILAKGKIILRCDVKNHLTTRKLYRRSRRSRKTRYRKERFLNRVKAKKQGWLPPSIRSRIDNTFVWIDKFAALLPNPVLSINVGNYNYEIQEKETTFMTIIRQKVLQKYQDAIITHNGFNKERRNSFKIVQFRKKKRSLHEANPRKGRTKKNTLSKRNERNTKQVKNWCLNDMVRVFEKIGFITGFTGKTACYIKDINGNWITSKGKNYKQVNLSCLKLMKRNNNWQYCCT